MQGGKKHCSSNIQKTGVQTKSTMKTSVQQSGRCKTDPFRKSTKAAKEDFFDIDFEVSQDDASSSCTLSQNSDVQVKSIFKNPKTVSRHENNVSDIFDVDFEESKEGSSEFVQSKMQSTSQNVKEPVNEDTISSFKQLELFKDPKSHPNYAFDVDLEETGNIQIQNMQQSQAFSTSSQKSVDLPSQGKSKQFPLFQNCEIHVNNVFEVDFEESKELSSPVMVNMPHSTSQTHNQDTTINFKQPELFKKPKTHSNCDFDIHLEESDIALTPNSQISSASQKSDDGYCQGETKKHPLFHSQKKNMNNINIDFDESNQLLQALSVPQPLSQTSDQDTTIYLKQPKLFKKSKSQSAHAFDFDLEESGEMLAEGKLQSRASSTSSQKSVDALSQGEAEKPTLFQNKRHVNNAFEVDFEESCQNENVGHSQNTQFSQSLNSNKENDASIKFAKPDPFRDSNHRRSSKPFDVDFEESRNLTNAMSSHGTPKQLTVMPFRKSGQSPEDDLDVNFNETDVQTNVNDKTEKSVTRLVTGNDSAISTIRATPMNMTPASSEFNQSSFNDENLGQWMSDHSEDEIEIDQRMEIETSHRKTLLPNDVPAPLDFTTEEDRMKQLQLKLKEIVENARSGKIQDRPPIIPRQKNTEKPKQLVNKHAVPLKTTLKKPAPFATKRLYNHIIGKIKSKYGIDSVVQAEELVISICDVVKMVVRRKGHQKKLIHDLKMEMAKMGVIETTYQFYDFVREFLPYEFRLKAVPCIQPGTNIVYPPKDAINPFDKIL